MGIMRKAFDLVVSSTFGILRLNSANNVTCGLAEKFSPVFTARRDGKDYHFEAPNALSLWRAKTFFTKEPETIEWINGFGEGDILFDVGANVGLYTIYASKAGVRVVAFEPESQNYGLLNRNIFLNQVCQLVLSLNIALSDEDKIDYLYIPKFQAGQALNNFGSSKDWEKRDLAFTFKQPVLSFTLDSFVQKYPHLFPNHIKVDVDGLEAAILRNGKQTLRDCRVKSLLVEINEGLQEDMEIVGMVESCGMKLKHKRHSAMFDSGEFSKVFNYVFVR